MQKTVCTQVPNSLSHKTEPSSCSHYFHSHHLSQSQLQYQLAFHLSQVHFHPLQSLDEFHLQYPFQQSQVPHYFDCNCFHLQTQSLLLPHSLLSQSQKSLVFDIRLHFSLLDHEVKSRLRIVLVRW